jgi:dihydropteroate synthase
MGIVNVTPDSFSDGGRYLSHAAAVEQGLRLIEEGADLLDIGGESTRPYAQPVDEREELRRVLAVVQGLVERTPAPLSIDTSKATVAREAIAAGAEIINDITGLAGDARMIETALAAEAGVCAMHMQGTPQTMQNEPRYNDVAAEVQAYLAERRDALLAAGLETDRICLDPGVGFGKTHQHNLTLLANCRRLHALGRPLLVGPSRKGFISKILGDPQGDRTLGTVGVCLALARQGVQILRVHDVAPIREALLLFEAAGGIDGVAAEL